MTFVSYAQNFEDVILWRALKHVNNGFYIDIGAQHPTIDSVSLAFYEHGWRGVHVEPTQQYSTLLRSARVDESVLQLAIGDQTKKLTFFEFEDTGLSTADENIARRHKEQGFYCRETSVPVLSLDTLLDQLSTQDIHWLKIDVEGLEKEVLQSWRLSTVFPWIVVIESTLPLTQEESHHEWEPLIIQKGYRFAYFDGLNRYYISHHHPELIKAFSTPPNVFDGFTLSGTSTSPFCSLLASQAQQAKTKAQQAETKAQQAETKVKQALADAQRLREQIVNLEGTLHHYQHRTVIVEQRIDDLLNSTSWRVTAPLRWLIKALRRGLYFASHVVRIGVRALLLPAMRFVLARQPLRKTFNSILKRFPSIAHNLNLLAIHRGIVPLSPEPPSVHSGPQPHSSPPEPALSPNAKRIYAQIKHTANAQTSTLDKNS